MRYGNDVYDVRFFVNTEDGVFTNDVCDILVVGFSENNNVRIFTNEIYNVRFLTNEMY